MILDTCKLVSLNVRASITFEREEQFTLGVENKRQISYFCRKRIQNKRQKDNGKMNGEVRL